jgi:hypothetical protein
MTPVETFTKAIKTGMRKKQIKDSDILKVAREFIRTEKEDYVCFAIESAAEELHAEGSVESLTDWSLVMLGTHSYLEQWLSRNVPEFNKMKADSILDLTDASENKLRNKVRETRLAWMSWMIKNQKQRENHAKEKRA